MDSRLFSEHENVRETRPEARHGVGLTAAMLFALPIIRDVVMLLRVGFYCKLLYGDGTIKTRIVGCSSRDESL
jgi:hypothetical protein